MGGEQERGCQEDQIGGEDEEEEGKESITVTCIHILLGINLLFGKYAISSCEFGWLLESNRGILLALEQNFTPKYMKKHKCWNCYKNLGIISYSQQLVA